MTPVADDGIDVHFEQLAARIRRSSNFRVAWQLFEWDGPCKASPRTARQVIETIALVGGTFERTLARATADSLGAHSRIRADALPEQIRDVQKRFQGPGPYVPFELLPGEVNGCLACRGHNAHLFSDWFFGVAWDWCYCVIWEARRLVGILCMTDTD
jgi:hypothetical protein